MKKIKIFATLVALSAASVAIATKPSFDCSYNDQYYYNGTSYLPAGELGYDFICLGTTGVCTYYRPDPFFQPNYYAPCKYGNFVPIEW